MTPFRISRFTPRARSPIPTIFSHPRTSGRSMAALAFLVAVLLMLTACGGATTDATSGAGSGGTAQTTAEKTFTTEELAAFNGQNGNPAYIAVDGVVYDVTKVSTWGRDCITASSRPARTIRKKSRKRRMAWTNC